MKFVEVDVLPERKRGRHRLRDKWEEFMSMNVKVVKIDLDINEYKSPTIAQNTMYKSIKQYGYPIDVTTRYGEVYLIRRDM